MTVRRKVLLGFTILLVLMLALGTLSIVQMNRMGQNSTEVKEIWVPSLVVVGNLNGQVSDIPRLVNRIGLESDQAEIARMETQILQLVERIDEGQKLYETYIVSENERLIFNEFHDNWQLYKEKLPLILSIARQDDTDKTIREIKAATSIWEAAKKPLDRLMALNQEGTEAATSDSLAISQSSLIMIITGIIVAVIIGLVLSLLTMRDLKSVSTRISQSAESVASSSEEITASVQEIAKGSQYQANTVSNVSEMMEQMNRAISQIASTVEETSSFVNQTTQVAHNGGLMMKNATMGMQEISDQVNQLMLHSRRVDEIVTVIREMAEQTKLLALNASIEAARAGEHGRGFAVVADAVGKLANQSGEATKEITQLVQSMQDSTLSTVETVKSGNELVKKAEESFSEIIHFVQESAGKVSEIAANCEEQAAQTNEVLQAAQNIAAITEETSASAEETATATEELAGMAENLNNLVGKL